jgi:hypothetical protein
MALSASLACIVLQTAAADAALIRQYQLMNKSGRSFYQVDFEVTPGGSVLPPTVGVDKVTGAAVQGSPLVVLPGSMGFRPDTLSVALGADRSGSQQGLRLLFGDSSYEGLSGPGAPQLALPKTARPAGGLIPGAVMKFGVYVDPETAGQSKLKLPANLRGLILKDLGVIEVPDLIGQTPGTGGSNPIGGEVSQPVPIPEPATVVGWLVCGSGAWLWRRSARRRGKPERSNG